MYACMHICIYIYVWGGVKEWVGGWVKELVQGGSIGYEACEVKKSKFFSSLLHLRKTIYWVFGF
jgi:hypothetical protein